MAALPIARVSSPTDLVRLVPHLCGFVPSESLVVLSLRGPRKRVGLTIRVDLPPDDLVPDLTADLAARLTWDGATEALLVVYTADPEQRPRRELVAAVSAALAGADVRVQDALLVRDGRWWSYTCDDQRCCPARGVPVSSQPPSPAIGLVEATQALDGRAVLPSRDELVASLRPPSFLAAAAAEQALRAAAAAWAADDPRRRRPVALDALRDALRCMADPRARLQDPARLVVALGDIGVRDQVLTWVLDEEAALLDLLHRLADVSVAPFDAPVCTLLAVVAWCRGSGALANVALDRALASDPGYSLAALVRAGLDRQVPPAAVRRWLATC